MIRPSAIASSLALLMLAACGKEAQKVDVPKANEPPKEADGGSGVADSGSFLLRFESGKSETHEQWRLFIEQLGLFEIYADALNQQLKLPADITIVGRTCGANNAYYDPDKLEICICYDYPEYVKSLMEHAGGRSADDVSQVVADDLAVTLMHEVGHALIDQLNLPITGQEEDVADQISVVSLISEDAGAEAVFHSAQVFAEFSKLEDPGILYWDTHSLSSKRFANLLCWIYGSDSARFAEWPSNGTIDASRAQGCAGEYVTMHDSLAFLLKPYQR